MLLLSLIALPPPPTTTTAPRSNALQQQQDVVHARLPSARPSAASRQLMWDARSFARSLALARAPSPAPARPHDVSPSGLSCRSVGGRSARVLS